MQLNRRIRIELPTHLRTLASISGPELLLAVCPPFTLSNLLDTLEAHYPVLRGTIREHGTHRRRAFLRFFACQVDLSHEPPSTLLPDAVVEGREPLIILAAIAGGC
ncbi:MoaD/ThiS family protein [Acidipila sp. EB88]|uniref:MoaD/ThiS family protein n=1 Tax=Acidipila sp. EB88 TaxID=2305226 RepID=UPI000F5F3CF7|nr:MoaD/ThiS family protein [Acidipila sp. EB88]RRA49841.1 hypothetical protein D1Y84_17815 [Acidipila sp. EB88]